MENNLYKTKLWKRILSVILAVIIGFGTFVTMTFANVLLSDYVDLKSVLTVKAATLNPVPVYYRHGELIGLYRVNYSDKTKLQYKIGEDGEWTDYSVPFAIPAHKTTKVYARIGTTGKITYMNLSNTDEALGVYTESNTDFSFSYNGIDFGYTRIYNSADKDWFESIHSKVLVTNSRLEVTLPDGSKYPMIRKDSTTYVDELNGYTLTKTNDNYIFDDGTYKYYFAIKALNSVAYLGAIEDNNGNKLNLNRTTNSEEISISDGAGRSFALSDYQAIDAPDGSDVKYYSQKEITDPNGNKLKYTTKQGKYIEIKDQAGVILGKYEYTNNTTDFTLVKSNDNKIEYYSNGRLKQITYKNGSWIKYTYNNDSMNYTTLTSSGETTKTVYNDAFKTIEYTDESGTKTEYTYDSNYRVKTEKSGDETTTYTYDSKGNILSYVKSNEKNNTYYTYNSNGKIVREQSDGNYKYYTYDNKGNNLIYATLKEEYTGEAPALYDSSLTCFDTTTYTYDDKGRILKEENSDGSSVSYEYNTSGNVTKETNVTVENDKTKTTVTTYTYDEMGNILTTQSEGDNGSYIYDKAGRTLRVTQNGKTTRTLYDDEGRVIQEITAEDYDSSKDGLPSENTYSDANAGHRYVYNEVTGNLDSETNRLDVTTTYKYNDVGAKIQEKFDIYEFNYIPHGELESVKISGKTKVSYSYDDNNKLLSESYANGDTVRYEYDDNGNLTAQYRNGSSKPYVTYSYNTDNELTKKVNYDSDLKYIYGDDNSVEVYRLSDDTLVQSYTEDVTEADEDNGIEAKTNVTESHFGDTYSYTTKNNSISYQYDDNSLTYSAKSDDKSQTVSDTVKFNGNELMKSTYTYDDNSNVTLKELSNTDGLTKIANKYDSQNRITATGYEEADGSIAYDENGQVTHTYYSVTHVTSTYSYDSRGNILTAKDYNDKGLDDKNIKSSRTFTYSNDGWKDELTAVNGTSLTYDENGNVLTYGDKSFTWNTGRNLESITDGDNKYSYTYDENGIRTSKTVNGKTTYYNTKDGVILSQTDGTDTIYFQYNSNGTPLGFVWNGTQYFYLTNQMGDVISITDAQGIELVQYEYDAWGKCVSTVTVHDNDIEIKLANINPIRYRGYYLDFETNYYYLQSRYYDSNICRFINADSAIYLNKDSLIGINLFSYCKNDPINMMDINGKEAVLSIYAIAKIIITVIAFIGISLIAASIINNSTYNEAINGVSSLHSSYRLNTSAIITILKEFIKSSYTYAKSRVSSKSKAIAKSLSIAIADAKVKTAVKREKKSTYWNVYKRDGYIILGNKISRTTAINKLRSGLLVFSSSKYNARNIAMNASGGKTPYGPERHGDSGYFYHYHLYKHKTNAHSFYL